MDDAALAPDAGAPSPSLPAVSPHRGLDAALVDKARDYARRARTENTGRAYGADWRAYAAWCRKRGLFEPSPDPQLIGLYITALAFERQPSGKGPLNVRSIERRLAGLGWHFRQRGTPLDRQDPHIREVLAGIRRQHARPPVQKEPVLSDDVLSLLDTLALDLRGLRDRAILMIGFGGGLRRSEIVGLDEGPDQTEDGDGWVEIFDEGAVLTVRGKTGWREVEVGRGSSERTCPVAALETWIALARIAHGPLFRRVSRDGKRVLADRLTDKHVARLVNRTALAAGVRADLPEGERRLKFAGHSLRAGLGTAAEADERYVQQQFGHSTVEMTRRYQRRRNRFRVNLTKAAGL